MIIVTGGAGFIGSNLIASLTQDLTQQVIVVDHLGNADKWRNLAKSPIAGFVPINEIFPFLNQHHAQIEMIYHMGASSATTEADVDFIMAQNFNFTLQLWDFCTQYQKKFIYASSAASYGDGELGFDDDNRLEALCALRPLNPYGWSKALTDIEIIRRARKGKDNAPPFWAGLKFFNVYGANEYHKGGQRSVAHQIYEQIIQNGKVKLFKSSDPNYEDGGQMRDFVYVKDCVQIMQSLLQGAAHSGIYNVGSGVARSFLDLAKAGFAALDRPVQIEWMETPAHIAKHYQYYTCANMDRARNEIGKWDAWPLEAGIKDYFSNYLQKKDPYQ